MVSLEAIYFEKDFRADGAQFMESLSQQIDGIEDLGKVQADLEANLDQVELELMDEVNKQSAVFFSALSVIRDLQDELGGLSAATAQLSAHLSQLTGPLKADLQALEALVEEQEMVSQVGKVLERLDEMMRSRERIQMLLNECMFDEALTLIRKVEEDLRCLDGFKALQPLMLEVGEMKVALQKMKLASVEMDAV